MLAYLLAGILRILILRMLILRMLILRMLILRMGIQSMLGKMLNSLPEFPSPGSWTTKYVSRRIASLRSQQHFI